MRPAITALALVSASLASFPILAQDALTLAPGTPLRIAPGKDRTPVIATFLAEAGARQVITVKSATPVEITLFEPGGQEMLHKEGSGVVTLTAHLPWLDSYAIAITRADPKVPAVVETSGSAPHVMSAFFGNSVGVTQMSQNRPMTICWVIPGSVHKILETGLIATLAADGSTVTYALPNHPSYPITETNTFTGEGFESVTRQADGATQTKVFKWPSIESLRRRPDAFPYVGYYCPGATPSH